MTSIIIARTNSLVDITIPIVFASRQSPDFDAAMAVKTPAMVKLITPIKEDITTPISFFDSNLIM